MKREIWSIALLLGVRAFLLISEDNENWWYNEQTKESQITQYFFWYRFFILVWKPWLVCSVCHRSEREKRNHLHFPLAHFFGHGIKCKSELRCEGKNYCTHISSQIINKKSNQSIFTPFSQKNIYRSDMQTACFHHHFHSFDQHHIEHRAIVKKPCSSYIGTHFLLVSVSHWFFFCEWWWFMKGKWSLFLHCYTVSLYK